MKPVKLIIFFAILMNVYINPIHAQKIEIQWLMDSIFCKAYHNSNQKGDIYYVREDYDSIFSYNSSYEPSCIKVITYKVEKDFISKLKRKKQTYLVRLKNEQINQGDREEIITFSLNMVDKKEYTGKTASMIHQDDYKIYLKKNNLTGYWVIKKIKYPSRIQSMIK